MRFESPGFGGQRTPGGLGFLIDGRGWIVTNLAAVADATTATRAVLANGVACELSGVVAKDPKCGLAILKLRERPMQMTVLDLAAEGPRADDRGFLVGHPFNADFAFAPATVVAVLASTALPPGVRRRPAARTPRATPPGSNSPPRPRRRPPAARCWATAARCWASTARAAYRTNAATPCTCGTSAHCWKRRPKT